MACPYRFHSDDCHPHALLQAVSQQAKGMLSDGLNPLFVVTSLHNTLAHAQAVDTRPTLRESAGWDRGYTTSDHANTVIVAWCYIQEARPQACISFEYMYASYWNAKPYNYIHADFSCLIWVIFNR